MGSQTLKVRVDMAGALSNAVDTLRGKYHAWRGRASADDRRADAAMLEMIAEHVRKVREGDEATLADFLDLYGIRPGAMLPTEEAA